MSQNINIAGLQFELQLCKKMNETPLESWEISNQPLANVYTDQEPNSYTVNILSYIPTTLENIAEINQPYLDLLPEDPAKLIFTYEGVNLIKTSINKPGEDNIVLCRNFMIDYNSSQQDPVQYNLYLIKLTYNLVNDNAQSVEAIIVHDRNLDPETSRGTVTTTRY